MEQAEPEEDWKANRRYHTSGDDVATRRSHKKCFGDPGKGKGKRKTDWTDDDDDI